MNHTLFWGNLTPEETAPGPETTKAIAETFGGLDALKADMSAKTVAVQVCKSGMKDICFLLLFLVLTLYFFQNVGSGWGWLGYNAATKRVEVASCANQDPLKATTGLVPLLGIDVWEHAYYVD